MNIKPQVLVIDDDEVVGRSFDRVLSRQGYEVSTALSGEEAISKIDHEAYDLVFTDIRMPGMDGLEVAEKIIDRCPWTPVIVITGYGTDANESQAKILGASGFVHKPLTPEMIENITLKALQPKQEPQKVETTTELVAETGLQVGTEVAAEPLSAPRGVLKRTARFARNVGLFFAAPFIGLAYVIALPFVFFGMAIKLGYAALTGKKDSG